LTPPLGIGAEKLWEISPSFPGVLCADTNFLSVRISLGVGGLEIILDSTRLPYTHPFKIRKVIYELSTGLIAHPTSQMSLGLFSHPFASFSGYDHPLYVNVGAHPFFAASSTPFVVRPRRHSAYQVCNNSGRCVPWRRAPATSPSVLEFLTHSNNLESIWEALFHEEPQETKQAEASPSAASPAASTEVVAPKPTTAVLEAPKRRLGAVEVRESESGTEFDVALPGLALEDVKLDFDFKRRLLHVKAEKKFEEVVEEDEFWGKQTSVRHVSVARSLPIPEGVKPEDVKADFVDGVLSIAVAHKALEAPKEPETVSLAISSAPSSSEPSAPAENDASPSESLDKTEEPAEPESTASNETELLNPSASPSPAATVTISPPEPSKTESDTATVEDAE